MGIIDDKKNIFSTIGAYTSLNEEQELPQINNIFSSVNNDKDIGSFLIDILNILFGTTALQDTIGELFTNFTDDIEPQIKGFVNNQLIDETSGNDLPSTFKNQGYFIPIERIDVYGKYKSTPQVSNLTFDTNSNSFDSKINQAINQPNTDVTYNNLILNYNDSNELLNLKSTVSSSNQTIGEWLNSAIDNTIFFNKKTFISNVMNNIFGTLTNTNQKTNEEIANELQVDKILNNLIEDNQTFNISNDELTEIFNTAEQLEKGVVYHDLGCGIFESKLNVDDMTNIVENISGSTNPFFIGNMINKSLNDSFSVDSNGVSDENEETLRNGFFNRIIRAIQLELSKIITVNPQIKILFIIVALFQGRNNNSNTNIDDIEDNKVFINCLIKKVLALLYEFLFNLIVSTLLNLLNPVIKRIIREKLNQYTRIIRSLVSSQII